MLQGLHDMKKSTWNILLQNFYWMQLKTRGQKTAILAFFGPLVFSRIKWKFCNKMFQVDFLMFSSPCNVLVDFKAHLVGYFKKDAEPSFLYSKAM